MNQIVVKDFSLSRTIENGQFFLYEKLKISEHCENTEYEKVDGYYYYLIINEKFVRLKQEENILYYEGISEDEVSYFLSLDVNYLELISDFNEDKYLSCALEKYYGMRLLRQPLWETIIGFVCSSAANIPKIRMNLMLISEFFGEKKHSFERTYFTFPKAGDINDLDLLLRAKLGYRAKYVFAINKMVQQNPLLLDKLKNSNYEDSMKILVSFPGIGEKVANCICLFALGHSEACPVDTWVRQAVEKLYLNRKAKNNREVTLYLQNKFKKNLGFKQQYLFEYIRKL